MTESGKVGTDGFTILYYACICEKEKVERGEGSRLRRLERRRGREGEGGEKENREERGEGRREREWTKRERGLERS